MPFVLVLGTLVLFAWIAPNIGHKPGTGYGGRVVIAAGLAILIGWLAWPMIGGVVTWLLGPILAQMK